MAELNLQDEIAVALSEVSDPGQKAILLLMMRGFGQISAEIKSMRADIPGLREAVLNGHAPVHHDDHEWIAAQRAKQPERDKCCAWCADKMAEEADDIASRRKIRDALVEKAIWSVLIFISGVVVARFVTG